MPPVLKTNAMHPSDATSRPIRATTTIPALQTHASLASAARTQPKRATMETHARTTIAIPPQETVNSRAHPAMTAMPVQMTAAKSLQTLPHVSMHRAIATTAIHVQMTPVTSPPAASSHRLTAMTMTCAPKISASPALVV